MNVDDVAVMTTMLTVNGEQGCKRIVVTSLHKRGRFFGKIVKTMVKSQCSALNSYCLQSDLSVWLRCKCRTNMVGGVA